VNPTTPKRISTSTLPDTPSNLDALLAVHLTDEQFAVWIEACSPMDLDALMTVEQFAAWQQVNEREVRKRLHSLPGVVRESRKWVRIHPRTYFRTLHLPDFS
jgi:hypothetical protein